MASEGIPTTTPPYFLCNLSLILSPSLYLLPLPPSLPLSPSQHSLPDNHCQRTSKRSTSQVFIFRQGAPVEEEEERGEGRFQKRILELQLCCRCSLQLQHCGLLRGFTEADLSHQTENITLDRSEVKTVGAGAGGEDSAGQKLDEVAQVG